MSTKRSTRASRPAHTAPTAPTVIPRRPALPGKYPSAPGGSPFTGRYIVVMKSGAANMDKAKNLFKDSAGMTMAKSSDFKTAASGSLADSDAQAKVLEHLGMAIVESGPEQMGFVAAAGEDGPFLAIEPEEYVYACAPPLFGVGAPGAGVAFPGQALPLDYLKGYRDAVNQLVGHLLGEEGDAFRGAEESPAAPVEHDLTYGLQLCNIAQSQHTGKGIRIAVLDTGFDMEHPDFLGRQIVSKSFIADETVQDEHGHGTHCIGTACGPRKPGELPRYGVAWQSEIYVGKVLNNQGFGVGGSVLEGIDWAISQKCHVISMSLSSPVSTGQNYYQRYEMAARRGMDAGCLLVAAAGNDSNRPFDIQPVGSPANCPSILSVGGVDSRLQMYVRSNGGVNQQGGKVDIAGPGVDVKSSYPRAKGGYSRLSGTSMATPHVAGVAALLAEAVPSARGMALWALLLQKAKPLNHPARDIGTGLVQAM